jgi:hypothetical protein
MLAVCSFGANLIHRLDHKHPLDYVYMSPSNRGMEPTPQSGEQDRCDFGSEIQPDHVLVYSCGAAHALTVGLLLLWATTMPFH